MSVIKPIVTANFADHVVQVLTPLLGPHTAKRALAMICKMRSRQRGISCLSTLRTMVGLVVAPTAPLSMAISG